MNIDLDNARLDLESLIDEYMRVLNADEESDRIAPDGRAAHLGRIIAAGQVTLTKYNEVAGDQADPDLLNKVPATFAWPGHQP